MAKKRKLAHSANKKHKAPGHPAAPKHSGPKNNNNNGNSSHSSKPNRDSQKQSSSSSSSSLAPTIPFDPEEDNILLVGEGDLSFAASLIEHHKCLNLTATVLEDSRDALLAKYPHAADKADLIEGAGARVLYGVDAKTMGPWGKGKGAKKAAKTAQAKKEKEKEKEKDEHDVGADTDDPEQDGQQDSPPRAEKKADKGSHFDRILFNFPHVGGKSTDVNRQVRYNQELLVAFFQRALLSLAPKGSIVVTLFEGEPYTLWNIRDLARHAGLQVERSFRFQFSAYPGYHHARTLGVVRKGASAAESTSAWKGEDRPSRSYVFVRKGATTAGPAAAQKTKGKRSRGDSSSSDDDDDNDDNDDDDDD